MSSENQLLDSKQTKVIIEKLFDTSNNQIFLSAFFTYTAYAWLEALSSGGAMKLVIRARPNDFILGATNLSAVREAVASGWDIRFISALHAKVYLLGNKIVVGSGNLTSNGMHLMDTGNLELNSVIDSTQQSVALINSVFKEAQPFDEKILDKMEEFLLQGERISIKNDWWPSDVVPPLERELFCNDLPQCKFQDNSIEMGDIWAVITKHIEGGDTERATKSFKSSQAFIWVHSTLESAGGSMHFGALTKSLHNTLVDDPAPYRSTIKMLLANLLTYIQAIPDAGIAVERPRHSQIVKLI